MIYLKKIDNDSYEAQLDIKTFESYGLDSERVDEIDSFDNVDNLISEIITKIHTDFGDEIGEHCGVGILLETALNRVVIRICKGNVFDDETFDPFGLEDMEDDVLDTVYGMPRDTFNELEKVVNDELNSTVKDYTNGITLEFTDFEDVIFTCNNLKKIITKDEIVKLYSEPDNEIYYLHIDKLQKLIGLFAEYTHDEEDDDICMELEYALSEDIYTEYQMLNAYCDEKGILSNKGIQYLDEYAIELMNKNVLNNITKIFK